MKNQNTVNFTFSKFTPDDQATSSHQHCNLLIWRFHPLQFWQKRIPQLEKESMQRAAESSRGCAANYSFTRQERWRATLSQMMTDRVSPVLNIPLSSGGNSLYSWHPEMCWGVLVYGLFVGMWQRTPSLRMAAYMAILAQWQRPSVQWLASLERLKPASFK